MLPPIITESHNQGQTFGTPVFVSDTSSNPSNSTFHHEYHGLVNFGGGDSYCVWNDYRNENADIYIFQK